MKKDLVKQVRDKVKQDSRLTLEWLNQLFPIPKKQRRNINHFFLKVKNGTISGAADNDPSTIITHIQAGAVSGFSLLWLIFLSTPFLIAIEEISATLAVATRKGFARLIREKLGLKIAVMMALIVLASNVATIGANFGVMIDIINASTHIPNFLIVLILLIIFIFLLLKESYAFISRFLFIMTPLFLIYIISAILARPDWSQVAINTVNPLLGMNKDIWLLAVAMLGTVLCPYIVFWQATEEIEEKKEIKDLKNENYGVRFGMVFSNLIFYFVIIAAGATLFGGFGDGLVGSAREAAEALRPAVGNLAFLLFGIGIFVSGLIAIPVLAASSAYVVADIFNWKEGLNKKMVQAKSFYIVLLLALFLGAAINFLGLHPMIVLVYSQVLNGLLMPFVLIVLLKLGFDKKIVGEHRPSSWIKFFAYAALIVFVIADIAMFL
ncbi:MAG: divalent metal cation transporter [Patescibacteria group bacterium]|nr:divalent metal cation transporter [Patescibacteria group bacterium]